MQCNMLTDKLLHCLRDNEKALSAFSFWQRASEEKGETYSLFFLMNTVGFFPPSLTFPCLGEIIEQYTLTQRIFLVLVLMSRFILNAWWWITPVMNSIRFVTSETVAVTEFLLTCTCSSLSEFLTHLVARWLCHVYMNGPWNLFSWSASY